VALLEVQNVCYTYPGAQPVEALRGITFVVERNEFVSVIGPSGCGKSTLLRLIADLLPVKAGIVLIDGEAASVARRKREIGFVFQDPALMPWRSSIKNVRLPLEVLRRDDATERAASDQLLRLVGLADFAGKRPDQLSGGMKQRVSIARALTYDPPLLLMDEPFGALDQITRDEMNTELLHIWEQKASTVVFVTHSIGEAIYLSDRVVVLSARPGTIVDIVDVPLPRPRDPAIKRSREFFDIETGLFGTLEGRTVHGQPG
jgi:NitT/TauT family transport system ATP-binding protein